MRAEIEVEFCRMSDSHIDSCSRWNIVGLSNLVLLVNGEQSGVMSLLDGDEGDSRLVSSFEHHASLSHGTQLVL